MFDRLHLNDANPPVDVHTQTGDDAPVLSEAADSTQVVTLPHCTFDTVKDFERARGQLELEEYDEYVALASRWGTGPLHSCGYDYDYMLSMELSARLITTRCIACYQHLKNGMHSQCTSVITHRLRQKHNLGTS